MYDDPIAPYLNQAEYHLAHQTSVLQRDRDGLYAYRCLVCRKASNDRRPPHQHCEKEFQQMLALKAYLDCIGWVPKAVS